MSPPASILVDGVPAGVVPVTDRGFAFGDGVFRTIAVRGGRPLNFTWHMRRLRLDCEALRLACPPEDLVLGEVARVAPGDAVVKVTLTRGSAGRGYGIPADAAPRRVVASFPNGNHDPSRARDGVRIRRCELVLSEQPRLAGAKTLNRLENVLARGEWHDPAIAEGLLCDAAGRLVEGTMSNVFLVTGGSLCTPDLSRCGVVGAQRERLREILAADGLACEVGDIPFERLGQADEVFLTNSVIGVWPVCALDSRSWKVGAVTRRAQALVEADDARV